LASTVYGPWPGEGTASPSLVQRCRPHSLWRQMRYLAFAGAAPPRRGAYYRRYRRGVGPQLPDDGTGALPLPRGIILNGDNPPRTSSRSCARSCVWQMARSLAAECAISTLSTCRLASWRSIRCGCSCRWLVHASLNPPETREPRGSGCEGSVPDARSVRHCRAGASLRRPVYWRTRVGNRKSIDRRRSDDRAHAGPLHAVPQFKCADL
jgi:hypothetical protein